MDRQLEKFYTWIRIHTLRPSEEATKCAQPIRGLQGMS